MQFKNVFQLRWIVNKYDSKRIRFFLLFELKDDSTEVSKKYHNLSSHITEHLSFKFWKCIENEKTIRSRWINFFLFEVLPISTQTSVLMSRLSIVNYGSINQIFFPFKKANLYCYCLSQMVLIITATNYLLKMILLKVLIEWNVNEFIISLNLFIRSL